MGEADQVFAIEEAREGRFLDRGGIAVSEGGDGIEGGLPDSEAGERLGDGNFRRRQPGGRGWRGCGCVFARAAPPTAAAASVALRQGIMGGGVRRRFVVDVLYVLRGPRRSRGWGKRVGNGGWSGSLFGSALSPTGEK
ncbi:MAG: hypothetical protein AB7N24_05900 [Dehalococcoidia bacterium]